MTDHDILEALAEAAEAAARALRSRIALLDADNPDQSESHGALAKARALHRQLGERQAEIIELLEAAEPTGTDTGTLHRTLGIDQPNVYLTLKNLIRFDFAEKDETTKPHTYRLGAALREGTS